MIRLLSGAIALALATAPAAAQLPRRARARHHPAGLLSRARAPSSPRLPWRHRRRARPARRAVSSGATYSGCVPAGSGPNLSRFFGGTPIRLTVRRRRARADAATVCFRTAARYLSRRAVGSHGAVPFPRRADLRHPRHARGCRQPAHRLSPAGLYLHHHGDAALPPAGFEELLRSADRLLTVWAPGSATARAACV